MRFDSTREPSGQRRNGSGADLKVPATGGKVATGAARRDGEDGPENEGEGTAHGDQVGTSTSRRSGAAGQRQAPRAGGEGGATGGPGTNRTRGRRRRATAHTRSTSSRGERPAPACDLTHRTSRPPAADHPGDRRAADVEPGRSGLGRRVQLLAQVGRGHRREAGECDALEDAEPEERGPRRGERAGDPQHDRPRERQVDEPGAAHPVRHRAGDEFRDAETRSSSVDNEMVLAV